MTTKKQLPVWRMNTGNGVPSDLGVEVVDFSGYLYDSLSRNVITNKKFWLWFGIVKPTISAYQTTRTKAAKYRG